MIILESTAEIIAILQATLHLVIHRDDVSVNKDLHSLLCLYTERKHLAGPPMQPPSQDFEYERETRVWQVH